MPWRQIRSAHNFSAPRIFKIGFSLPPAACSLPSCCAVLPPSSDDKTRDFPGPSARRSHRGRVRSGALCLTAQDLVDTRDMSSGEIDIDAIDTQGDASSVNSDDLDVDDVDAILNSADADLDGDPLEGLDVNVGSDDEGGNSSMSNISGLEDLGDEINGILDGADAEDLDLSGLISDAEDDGMASPTTEGLNLSADSQEKGASELARALEDGGAAGGEAGEPDAKKGAAVAGLGADPLSTAAETSAEPAAELNAGPDTSGGAETDAGVLSDGARAPGLEDRDDLAKLTQQEPTESKSSSKAASNTASKSSSKVASKSSSKAASKAASKASSRPSSRQPSKSPSVAEDGGGAPGEPRPSRGSEGKGAGAEEDPWLDSASVAGSVASADSLTAAMHTQIKSGKRAKRGGAAAPARRAGGGLSASSATSAAMTAPMMSPAHQSSVFRRNMRMQRIKEQRARVETFRPKTNRYTFKARRFDVVTEMELDRKRRAAKADRKKRQQKDQLRKMFRPKINARKPSAAAAGAGGAGKPASPAHDRLYSTYMKKAREQRKQLEAARKRDQRRAEARKKSGIAPPKKVLDSAKRLYGYSTEYARKRSARLRMTLEAEEHYRSSVKMRNQSLRYLLLKIKRDVQYAVDEVCPRPGRTSPEPQQRGGAAPKLVSGETRLDRRQIAEVMTKMGFFCRTQDAKSAEGRLATGIVEFMDPTGTGYITVGGMQKFLVRSVVYYGLTKKREKQGGTPSEGQALKDLDAISKPLRRMVDNYTAYARLRRWKRRQRELETTHAGLASKPEQSPTTRRAPEDHIRRESERMHKEFAEREARMSVREQKKQRDELKGCTFAPQVVKREGGVSLRDYGKDAFERLHGDHLRRSKHRDKVFKETRKQRLADLVAECTFRPKITNVPVSPSAVEVASPQSVAKEIERMRAARRAKEAAEEQPFKPVGAARATPPRAAPRREVLLYMDVQLSPQLTDRIAVRRGDNVRSVARGFARKHGLQDAYVGVLERTLAAQIGATTDDGAAEPGGGDEYTIADSSVGAGSDAIKDAMKGGGAPRKSGYIDDDQESF